MMEQSLCGNSYGCLPNDPSQMGIDWSWDGKLIDCRRCCGVATNIISFMVGEPIELFLGDEWFTETQAKKRYEKMLFTFFG